MNKAIYPGSFDPVTYGHIDIIKRAAKISDELIVAVLINSEKNPLFSSDERVKMLQEVCKDIPNVKVTEFNGLLIDYAKEVGASFIIRGLRAVTDFEYELSIAQVNRVQNPDIDTVFLTTALEYAYLSSSVVKEFASYGSDISRFVPDFISDQIFDKIKLKESLNGK